MERSILNDISVEDLRRAAEIREKITELQDELESLLSGGGSTGGRKKKARGKKKGRRKGTGKKRVLSPEGRERIREAQRKRWAKAAKNKKK